MNEEYVEGQDAVEGTADGHLMGLEEAEVARILEDYRRRQLREHMIGPITSFIVHVVALVLLSVYVVARPRHVVPEIEVSIEPMEIKEVEDKIVEEIENTEDELADNAPQMSVPDVPTENLDAALEDVSDEAPQTADDMDMEEVLDIVPHSTPLKMPGLYGGRSAAGRAGAVRRYGGTKGGQNAVLRALRWLAKVQLDNGSWENNPAHSGVALLCFLAHGETPLSEEFGVTVQKAMQWLASNMPKNKHWSRAYSHGIATYALAEAYGMTQIPFLKEAMDNGIETIVKGQQPGGGFDYHYKKGERWDMSVTGWQMQAMKAAWVSGCSVSGLEDAIRKVIRFTKHAYKGDGYNAGTFGYNSPGGAANLTGVGTLGLQLLGEKKCREAVGGGKFLMERRLPQYQKAAGDWSIADKCMYGWYYDTQAAFQQQGAEWHQWNTVFQPILVSKQHPEGFWQLGGSHFGGASTDKRILATTFACLQLEVYYRYLPTFQISKEHFIKAEAGLAEEGGAAGLIIE